MGSATCMYVRAIMLPNGRNGLILADFKMLIIFCVYTCTCIVKLTCAIVCLASNGLTYKNTRMWM